MFLGQPNIGYIFIFLISETSGYMVETDLVAQENHRKCDHYR